ncbi:MAG: hypothetical protein IJ282_03025 [Lachnospiraceae bacterium]|nr:hypothetical protein [Lachnospiraceae bacterium]
MIEGAFISIVNMSLTATVAILAVLLARTMLRRAPKIFSYILWVVVLFRLVCPVSFTADFSIYSLLPVSVLQQTGEIRQESVNRPYGDNMDFVQIIDGLSVQEEPHLNTIGSDAAENLVTGKEAQSQMLSAQENPKSPAELFMQIGSIVWLSGVGILVLYSFVTFVSLKKSLRNAVHVRDNVYTTYNLITPFVCGVIRPRIYLPAGLREEEKRYILLHEQIHIRRGDHLVKLMSFAALCLHWFNPFAWLAFFLSGKDMEMSCDEAVIRKLGSGVKKEYSSSLLALATGRRIISGVPLAFGEGDTGSRIKNVLRYKKPAVILVGVATVLLIVMCGMLLANPAAKDNQDLKWGQTAMYGVIVEVDVLGDGTLQQVVSIPGNGEVEIPKAKEVVSYVDKKNFRGLETGDVVRIVFSWGKDTSIMETYPGRFSVEAEKIEVYAKGYSLAYQGQNKYHFTIPASEIPGWEEAVAGDMLTIYDKAYLSGEESEALVEAKVLTVTEAEESGDAAFIAEVAMQDMGKVLQAFPYGVTYSVGKIPWYEASNGTYFLEILEYSKEDKTIEKYRWLNRDDKEEREISTDEPIYIGDCHIGLYEGIQEIENVYYEKNLTKFVRCMELGSEEVPKMCLIDIWDGKVDHVGLMEPYAGVGIRTGQAAYRNVGAGEDTWYEDIRQLEGEDVLDKYYTLAHTESLNVATEPGDELIEVYTGNIGDGDSGVVLFKDVDGNLLHDLSAHTARAGWNNIYVGTIGSETSGKYGKDTSFIMIVHIENRDTYGEYSYALYKLTKDGKSYMEMSSFTFGEPYEYDEEYFKQWVNGLEYYLVNSHLLLSTQDGEVRTGWVNDVVRYNYETLRPTGVITK